ncbi:MAG: hypothetical protein V3W20_09015 [Candidatus Neomarinimicrobiota bacterium]
MRINPLKLPSGLLPITRSLTLEYVISIVVSIIMVMASIVGILYSNVTYPTEKLSIGFISTDLLNLVVGLPVLLVSMWLTRKGKLTGLLCWPGALFYVLYIYTSYLAIPVSVLIIPYIFLITLSAYSIIRIIVSINGDAVRQRLNGVIPAKTTGSILTSIAVLVIVYQIVRIVTVLINQTTPDNLELVQWIDDLAVGSPALLIGGYLLLRRKALGYVAGAGLLLMCSLLFIGVIPAMVFQALSADTPIDVIGILIVLISGMVCFIPFVLFVKGVAKSRIL